MARIAGINIPQHKHTVIGLRHIYGVGKTRAQQICAAAGIAEETKISALSDTKIDCKVLSFSEIKNNFNSYKSNIIFKGLLLYGRNIEEDLHGKM